MLQGSQDVRERLGAGRKLGERHRPKGGGGHGHVQDGASHHRADDPESDVALGILRLLCGSRDGVEAVEGEEDDRRRGHHSACLSSDGVRRESVRHERHEVAGVEGCKPQRYEQNQRDDLDHHQHRVHRRALASPGDQHRRHGDDDEDGRKIDDPAGEGPRQQRCRNVESRRLHESGCVTRPADRNGAADHRVLEDETPADDPGEEFAHHRVCVGVGASGGGHHGCHFGVRERRASAHHAGNDERKNDGRTGHSRAHPD